MDKRRAALWGVTALFLLFVAWKLHSSHFDWRGFWSTCRNTDWRLLLLATLVLYTNFLFRAARWAVFLRPSLPPGQRVRWWQLAGAQFIGFAGLAALGRLGELIRPYLVSRRTGLPFPSQVAVVAVERIFDLGAFGLLFTANLLLSPSLNALPYSNKYRLFGAAIAGMMLLLVLFTALLRYQGPLLASIMGGLLGRFSPRLAAAVSARLLEFRQGLDTVGSAKDLLLASVYSLLTWFSIALCYLLVTRAFPSPVHDLTPSYVILLLGFSVVGGVVQLPGIGGGAQLLTITALTVLFAVPREMATSAGMILWAITSMSVIPAGLLFARWEQVSLRTVARQSGQAESAPAPIQYTGAS